MVATCLFDAHGSGVSSPAGPHPFGYGAQWGYYTDGETGLQPLTVRYYDAGAGRFLIRDPIGYAGGINLYGCVGNNLSNLVDPLGLDWEENLRYGLPAFSAVAGAAAGALAEGLGGAAGGSLLGPEGTVVGGALGAAKGAVDGARWGARWASLLRRGSSKVPKASVICSNLPVAPARRGADARVPDVENTHPISGR